jgi:hypothetical protein
LLLHGLQQNLRGHGQTLATLDVLKEERQKTREIEMHGVRVAMYNTDTHEFQTA